MRILSLGTAYGWWGELSPRQLDDESCGQIGGGEQAWLMTAFRLAERGHEVHVAGDFGRADLYRSVAFHQRHEALPLATREAWDAILAWCDLGNLGRPVGFFHDLPCGAALRVVPQQLNHVLDVAGVDVIVSPSEAHRRATVEPYFKGVVEVVPNGVDASRALQPADGPRDPFLVVYASSPDRGLHHLLRAWSEVRRREPRARLRVYYEIDRWYENLRDLSTRRAAPAMAYLADEIWRRAHELGGAGVELRGAVHPRRLARELLRTGVLAYPCDTVSWTEGFGQVPLEAACAGCYVIVSDQDALGEIHADHARVVPKEILLRDVASPVLEGIAAMAQGSACGEQGWLDEERRRALVAKWEWREAARRWETILRARGAGRRAA